MQTITSKDNETIKEIKKLNEKKYRDQKNQYIIEGIKMVSEAIEENAKINKIIICEDCTKNECINQELLYKISKYNLIYVTEKVFASITNVSSPQGILAVIENPKNVKPIDYKEEIIVILDGIQDPGNMGTILRTLDSANIKQVIISKNTTDPYNPKVVRSTMGAIFRVNIIRVEDLNKTIKEIKKNKFKLVCTSLQTDKSMYDLDYKQKAIVIGNEANGVSQEVQELADEKIKIPMLGKTESLNASVATGIIIYEYVRQKL